MQIHIIRGQNQIGGSIIEVRSDRARLILDIGTELDEIDPTTPLVNGLFQGDPEYGAVFVTHYHGDHVGLLESILPGIPVYMGEKAYSVHRAAKKHLGKSVREINDFLHSGEAITVGDIHITPFLCDHSAFDAYMLLTECEGKKLLYTGDFRANGRKSFAALLRRLPTVDVLITEGTTLSGSHTVTLTEKDLENHAVQIISHNTGKPVFINMAATNIDRLVTIYRAAKRTGRIFLEDIYTASIATAAGEHIPNPAFSDVRVFLTSPKDYPILQSYGNSKIGRERIAKTQFVMCVRPSMRSYLEKLSQSLSFEGGILFYSMWNGYKENESTARFLQFMEGKNVMVEDLHTSGHADTKTINELIERTNPEYIIPVHTENADWFTQYKNSKTIFNSKMDF